MKKKLTLGPLLYNWQPEKARDFYFRIAEEAPVDVVYLGEVVCSKRVPFFEPFFDEVLERLQKAGKEVVLSSLALITLPRELEVLRSLAKRGLKIEANDVAAIEIIKEVAGDAARFVVGPTINVLNEGTMQSMAALGGQRVVFASELKGEALNYLAGKVEAQEKEVQIFGRQSLAVSMRCYHARAVGRDKDHCRMACSDDADGLSVSSLDGQALLAINGVQTLSHGYLVLLDEVAELAASGMTHFRLAPQNIDMVQVSRLYKKLLGGEITSCEVEEGLRSLCGDVPFLNGYYHGCEGMRVRA